jgi:hypothetical protein
VADDSKAMKKWRMASRSGWMDWRRRSMTRAYRNSSHAMTSAWMLVVTM